MNLNEAIDLLKKNKYLVELTALPKIYTDEYGIYAKMTKKGRKKRNAKNTYKDDERYNDHEGTLWHLFLIQLQERCWEHLRRCEQMLLLGMPCC